MYFEIEVCDALQLNFSVDGFSGGRGFVIGGWSGIGVIPEAGRFRKSGVMEGVVEGVVGFVSRVA